MSIFRSPTPNYRSSPGGGGGAVPNSRFNLCDWLSSLISSPTPGYRSAPPDGGYPSPGDGNPPPDDRTDCPDEPGNQQQRPPCR